MTGKSKGYFALVKDLSVEPTPTEPYKGTSIVPASELFVLKPGKVALTFKPKHDKDFKAQEYGRKRQKDGKKGMVRHKFFSLNGK